MHQALRLIKCKHYNFNIMLYQYYLNKSYHIHEGEVQLSSFYSWVK